MKLDYRSPSGPPQPIFFPPSAWVAPLNLGIYFAVLLAPRHIVWLNPWIAVSVGITITLLGLLGMVYVNYQRPRYKSWWIWAALMFVNLLLFFFGCLLLLGPLLMYSMGDF